jgi:hypothetical protein
MLNCGEKCAAIRQQVTQLSNLFVQIKTPASESARDNLCPLIT